MWDTFERDGKLNQNGPGHLLDQTESPDKEPIDCRFRSDARGHSHNPGAFKFSPPV